nr:MAG TPA: hypothetical protein [Crassvirales sp.]
MNDVDILGLNDFMEILPDEIEETEENKEEIETSEEEIEDENKNNTSEDDNPGGVASEDQETEEEEEQTVEETTSSPNLYNTLANALKQESVLPDLDLENKELKSWDDFKDVFKEYIEKEVESKLDETDKFIKKAIENGADTKEILQYKNSLDYLESLTEDQLKEEGQDGEALRANIIYQDYLNRGMSEEKAKAKVKKIFDRGDDIDEVFDALESNKEFFNSKIEEINAEAEEKAKKLKKEQEDFYNDLYESISKDREPIKGIKITEETSKKILNTLKKPIAKDDSGRPLNAVQKYAKENPKDFQKVIGTLFVLTDGFKSFDKIIKATKKVAKKKAVDDLERVLTSQPIGLSDNPLPFNSKSSGIYGRDWDIVLD